MSELLVYFLKVNLLLAGLWLFCYLLLRNDSRFRRKRRLMNSGIAIALLLPLLLPEITEGIYKISYTDGSEPIRALSALTVPIDFGQQSVAQFPVKAHPIEWRAIASVCYATVAVILLLRVIIGLGSVARLSRRCRKKEYYGEAVNLIPGSDSSPFSFGKQIFVGENASVTSEMIMHERAHISQLHSADIFVAEVLTAFMWINPAAWLLRREIRNNLEYLADDTCVGSFDRKAYQLSLLKSSVPTVYATIYNGFNVISLKKRIRMINRISTTSHGSWIYLAAAPLLLGAMVIGCTSRNTEQSAVTSDAATVEDPIAMEEPVAPVDSITQEVSAIQSVNDATSESVIITESTREVTKTMEVNEENAPSYPEGIKVFLTEYIVRNIEYPQTAVDDGISGTVVVSFVVAPDGKVKDVKVVKGIRKDLDDAAVEVIRKSPKWNPAPSGKDSDPVILPVNFKIS